MTPQGNIAERHAGDWPKLNDCLVDLLADEGVISRLRRGLPEALEMADLELPKGNPAVGFLREHIITGFFINEMGADKVQIPLAGTERGYDITICGKTLSIKTVKAGGKIRLLWTPDSYKAGRELETYRPQHDLLIVHINWDSCRGGVYYIPVSVQCEVYEHDPRHYMNIQVGTNHRGAGLTTASKKALLGHEDTIRIEVDWIKRGLSYTPYDRWEKFWRERDA